MSAADPLDWQAGALEHEPAWARAHADGTPANRYLFADPGPLIRRVYAYVAYRLGEGADAEDVTSETFARALRYHESFDGSRGDGLPWLLGIARRCIAAHYASRVPVSELRELPVDTTLADDAALRIDLASAVARLGERERELVALRYGSDLSAKQIAALLGLRVNAVEVALHRALERLRARLEPRPDPGAISSADAAPQANA